MLPYEANSKEGHHSQPPGVSAWVKNQGTKRKVLSHVTYMYIKALLLTIHEMWPIFHILADKQTDGWAKTI
jgi:hypothetical protein